MHRRDRSRQIPGSRGQKPSTRFLKQAAPDHVTSRAMLDSIILVILAHQDFIKTSSTSRINFLAHLHNVAPAPSVGLLPFFNVLVWSPPRVFDMGWRALVRLRGLCGATVPTSNMLMMRNLKLTMIISVVACRERTTVEKWPLQISVKSAFYGHCHTPTTPLAVYAVSGRNHNDKHAGDTMEVRNFYLNPERDRRIDEFPWCFS